MKKKSFKTVLLVASVLLLIACERKPIVVEPEAKENSVRHVNRLVGTWASKGLRVSNDTLGYPYLFYLKITDDGSYHSLPRGWFDPVPDSFFVFEKPDCSVTDHFIVFHDSVYGVRYSCAYQMVSDTSFIILDYPGYHPYFEDHWDWVTFTKIDDLP
ncbi:MAG: hypothetical protein SPL47_02375 [Bacteroidales bacterium]|nr:hypothetical protein [Bacteroidales bacterium]